jgi:hypothetical protein
MMKLMGHEHWTLSGTRVGGWQQAVAVVGLAWTLALGLIPVSRATWAADEPGVAAPDATVREIQSAVQQAIQRFERRDTEGVLANVSEQYRTGPFTKPVVREQLRAIYAVYDDVKARVRVDQVRVVGDHVWVYSSGEVSGRLALIGYRVSILSWERELEVARREGTRWRLFGYQQ